jgi:hypothetical protein
MDLAEKCYLCILRSPLMQRISCLSYWFVQKVKFPWFSRICNLLTILITITACTFNPDTEYFKNIQRPNPTATSISFFSDEDTTDFRGFISLNLQSANQSEIEHYELSIGDEIISEQNGAPYQVSINSANYPDGIYDLKLTLVKRVIGESLASKVKGEFYTVEFKKKVVVFNAALPKPVMNAAIEEGVLVLRWKPYKGRLFKHITVTGPTLDNPVVIASAKQATLSLPDFVGGSGYFNITLAAYDEEVSNHQEFHYKLDASIERTSSGVNVTWGESPFINFDGVNITTYEKNKETGIFVLDKTQHSFLYPGTWVFPYDVALHIDVRSKSGVEHGTAYSQFTSTIPLWRSNYGVGLYKASNDSIYTTLTKSLTSYDHKTISLVNGKSGIDLKTRWGAIGVSPDGLSIFELQNNSTLIRIDPSNLADIESFSISSVTGTFNDVISIAVSDLQKVLMYVEKTDDMYYYVFDWKEKKLLYSGRQHDPSKNLFKADGKLFPDGRKFCQSNMIITMDPTPFDISYGVNNTTAIALPQKGHRVYWIANNLYERVMGTTTTVANIPYAKQVLKIIPSNEDFIGIVYNENGLLKIDFIELGTFNIIYTLETTLSANTHDTNIYYLIGRSFYMNEHAIYLFYQFDF